MGVSVTLLTSELLVEGLCSLEFCFIRLVGVHIGVDSSCTLDFDFSWHLSEDFAVLLDNTLDLDVLVGLS